MTPYLKIAALLCLTVTPTMGHSIELETLDLTFSANRIKGTGVDGSSVDLDNTQITLDAAGTVMGPLGFELGAGAATPSDTFRGADNMQRLSVALTYDLSNTIEVGAYGDWAQFDWYGKYRVNGYGVQARYVTDDWQVSGYLGQMDYDDLRVSDKADTLGLNVQYAASDRWAVGAYYDYEELSLVKLQRYGLSLGWRLTQTEQLPVILRASAGRHQIDDDTSDNFSVTLHIPLKGSGRFDRSRFGPHSAFLDGYAITGIHYGPTAPSWCTRYPERCR